MKDKIVKLLNSLNADAGGKLISIDIDKYVDKIVENATLVFIVKSNVLGGFIAYYDNDKKFETAFLTMIAINQDFQKLGYGSQLLDFSILELKKIGFKKYGLEVLITNYHAIKFYERKNFRIIEEKGDFYYMELDLLQ